MDQQSEPVQAQPKPEDRRRALFAAAGERIYLIEKLQLELNGIRDELEKDQAVYPPKTAIPKSTPAPRARKKSAPK